MALKKIIKYNPNLKTLAKHLRNNSTLSEVLLWNVLKGKKLEGLDFHRQKPIGEYIVDFYCPELNLVIEIDGISHNLKTEKDKERQEVLERLGFNFIRIYDNDVKKNLNGVIDYIKDWVNKNK
jgi:very-short-patch-repair endonuclease